jgi:hypothetical protein
MQKLQNNLAHTFTYPCEFELLTSHYLRCKNFQR